MSDIKNALKMIEENDVAFVDLRFTDPRGKWQHLGMCAHEMTEEAFTEGVMFDGSSIAGWRAINESDMTLIPDASTARHGPVRGAADDDRLLRHLRANVRTAL